MKSNIKKFKASHFIGNDCWADIEFHPHLETLNKWASGLGIQVFVTHSFRTLSQKIKGAVVKPASNSCHLVGHAVDFNLFSREIGFINSDRLELYVGKSKPSWTLHITNRLPIEAQRFVYYVKEHPILRWGGDFKIDPDPIHIDDNLYWRDKQLWEDKFYEIND